MSLHRSITEHETYKQALAEVARRKKANGDYRLLQSRRRAEFQQKILDFKRSAMAALRAGDPVPEEPAPPNDTLDSLGTELQDAVTTSNDVVRDALATIAPDVLPLLAADAEREESLVREAIAVLHPIVDRVNTLRSSAAQVRTAKGDQAEDLDRLTAAGLLQIVARGGQVLPRPTKITAENGPAILAAYEAAKAEDADWDFSAPRGNQTSPRKFFVDARLEGRR